MLAMAGFCLWPSEHLIGGRSDRGDPDPLGLLCPVLVLLGQWLGRPHRLLQLSLSPGFPAAGPPYCGHGRSLGRLLGMPGPAAGEGRCSVLGLSPVMPGPTGFEGDSALPEGVW